MAHRYGHKWVSQYGDDPGSGAAVEWRKTLAGLSPQQIREGLDADVLRGDDWPPSSARFRGMCLGIPGLAFVRPDIDAMERASSFGELPRISSFARLVWQQIDRYNYRHAGSHDAERMLREAYERACDHVMQGGELPSEPVALLEKPKPRALTPEERERNRKIAEDNLAAVAAMLRGA